MSHCKSFHNPRRIRLTTEQQDQLLERYFAFEPVGEIIASFGVSKDICNRLLKRRGLEPRGKKRTPRKPVVSKSARFWAKVNTEADADDCWEWQAGRYPSGYGKVSFNGRADYAHRVAWMRANGVDEIPPGVVIRHRCDNPPCCNPVHLVEGTQADNIKDREDRRRGNRKWDLTAAVREQIVDSYRAGLPGTVIAEQLGVSFSSVYRWVQFAGLRSDGDDRRNTTKRARYVESRGH